MIEVYALLTFPMTALVAAMWRNKWSKVAVSIVLAFFIWLNLFQTWQVSQGLLLTETASRAYYKAIFGKAKSDDAAAIAYFTQELQPDLIRSGWQKLLHGSHDTLVFVAQLSANDMEDSTGVLFTSAVKKNGRFGFRCDDEFSPGCYIESSDSPKMPPGDYLKISVSTFVRSNEMTLNTTNWLHSP